MSDENKIQLFTDEEVKRLAQGKAIGHDDMPMELKNNTVRRMHGETVRRKGNKIGLILTIVGLCIIFLSVLIGMNNLLMRFISVLGVFSWMCGGCMFRSKRDYDMSQDLIESEEKRGCGPSSADANYYWAEKERKEKEAMKTPQQKYDEKKKEQHDTHIKNINNAMRKSWIDDKWEGKY